jgi:hypothetical protein
MHTCNQEAEMENHEFEVSLAYIVRPCLKKEKKISQRTFSTCRTWFFMMEAEIGKDLGGINDEKHNCCRVNLVELS